MVEDKIEVKLLISEADIDDERLDQLIGVLISDLRDQDEIFSVRRLETGGIPEAAMGGSVNWRGLFMEVLPSKIEQLLDEVIKKFQRSPAKIAVSIDGFEYSVRVPISPEERQNLLKEVKKLPGKLIETKNSGKK
jgi:hypothetical protein